MISRVRPGRRRAKKGRWRVTRTINFCCYLQRIWTSWQKHKQQLFRTYEFYQSRLNLTCWDSRGSVATLTKSAACAQQFFGQIQVWPEKWILAERGAKKCSAQKSAKIFSKKSRFKPSSFISRSDSGRRIACTGAQRPSPSTAPAHNFFGPVPREGWGN